MSFVISRISTEYPELNLSEDEKTRLRNRQSSENEYHKFVDNHIILHQGLLDKRRVRHHSYHLGPAGFLALAEISIPV